MKKLETYLVRRLLDSVSPFDFINEMTPLNVNILTNFQPNLYDLGLLERFYFWNMFSKTKGVPFLNLVETKPDIEFNDFINYWVEINRNNG